MTTEIDCDPLSQQLLDVLLFQNPRAWRRREVLQITPLTPDSYSARISLQFHLTRQLVDDAWLAGYARTTYPPARPDEEVEIVLPIHYLPKHVLLGFSLEGPDGKPLVLYTSGSANKLSLSVFARFLRALDGDQTGPSTQFMESHLDVITALIFTGQGDVAERIGRLTRFQRATPFDFEYSYGMLEFYEGLLTQFTGQARLDPTTAEGFRRALDEIYRTIYDIGDGLRTDLGGEDGFSMPLLNPALLVVDYLKLRPDEHRQRVHQEVETFLHKSQAFLVELARLRTQEPDRYKPIVDFLKTLTTHYIAYARVRAPIAKDFMIKMEQIIPLDMEWWRRFVGGWRYQLYQLKLGGTGSTHIEVTCDNPVELQQVPRKSRVIIDQREARPDLVFSLGSHATRYRQHFYSNQSGDEIEKTVQARLPGATWNGDLLVKVFYTVEFSTMLGYWLLSIIALAGSVVFVRLYSPASLTLGQIQLVSLIPLLSGFFGAVASLRPQEKIVAIRVRKHKVFVLVMVFLMTAYLLAGLQNAWIAVAVRATLVKIPWLGVIFGG